MTGRFYAIVLVFSALFLVGCEGGGSGGGSGAQINQAPLFDVNGRWAILNLDCTDNLGNRTIEAQGDVVRVVQVGNALTTTLEASGARGQGTIVGGRDPGGVSRHHPGRRLHRGGRLRALERQ